MQRTGSTPQRGAGATPVALADCENPVDFLIAEHSRERAICALIDAAAAATTPDRAAMAAILTFLGTELPAHVHAEVALFFPLLRGRCRAEDEIGPVIDSVLAEHDLTMSALPGLQRILRRYLARDLAPGVVLTEADRAVLRDFAAHVRRHLVVENAIVMPIARARLSQSDLASLRRQMLQARDPSITGEHDAG